VKLDYSVVKPFANGCFGLSTGRRKRPAFVVRPIDGRAVARKAETFANGRLAQRRVAA